MSLTRPLLAVGLGFLLISSLVTDVGAGDWPMWRHDASRSAVSPHGLADRLYVQWTREYPRLEPAWENPLNRDLMQYDRVYEPVVMGKTLFIGSSAIDRLVALDTETGEEKWAFYTGGPVRLPPVAANGRVYFVCDDGYLYCVDGERGALIWRFRGGPSDRRVLGNSRLVSTWPARGGPVLQDGILYFAAGIWPFMGVFIHALDADTGEVLWTNDGSGSMYILQPHNSPAYGGVAPQGALVVAGDRLLVPGGRSVPACFDRHTGEFLYYQLAQHGKTGGAFVCALGDWFINYHRDTVVSLYDLATGNTLIPRFGTLPAVTEEAFFCMGDTVVAFDARGIRHIEYDIEVQDIETGAMKTVTTRKWVIDPLWRCAVDARGDLIKAGDRLYAGGVGAVSAVDASSEGLVPTVYWQEEIEGTAARLVAADDKLFVVTLEGRLYAFGGKEGRRRSHPYRVAERDSAASADRKAQAILETTGVREGYCLAYGVENGDLVEALVRSSDLHVIAVAPDPVAVDRLRRRFDAVGLYGTRVAVCVGDPFTFEAAPYLASLTVFEDLEAAGYREGTRFFERIYPTMRPYGGVACLPLGKEELPSVTQQVQEIGLPKAQVRATDEFLLLVREGALPGAGDWTHQYGNIANTLKSDDRLVRLPLGLLWFGGSSNMDVLPRHGHGPPEQVVGGRLFIEGIDLLNARDVYTGRVLWKRELPNPGVYGMYYDETYVDTPLSTAYNQVHIPGANARGTNFVAVPDKVYIVQGSTCLVLDPATGATLDEIELPWEPEAEQPPEWGYIGVYKDYLVAGTGLVRYTDFLDNVPEVAKRKAFYNFDITSSRKLVVMDRHTGAVRWSRTSDMGFRHNAIAVGDDRIFCIDMMPPAVSSALRRRGKKTAGTPTMTAFDVHTGDVVWSREEGGYGTWLSYSEEYDVLLQAGRPSRDMLVEEPRYGMAAYRGEDGAFLWRDHVGYGEPPILHGRTVITNRYAYDLLTGEQKMREDPVTGEEAPWMFSRRYGCNYAIASENLLTFRSAAAGFYDLEHDGGTGNLGGFKSGCTSNLIVADGVLNAPDYTRTCSCSYQNQSSLALVHMPEAELWVTYSVARGDGPIRDIGINLGAPGNRRMPDGRFWIAYPLLPHISNPEKESGIRAGVMIEIMEDGGFYTRHSSGISGGDGLPWVSSSGCRGISKLELDLGTEERVTCRVRLHFADPDPVLEGARVFDVRIEGKKVLEDFDIFEEAGGQNRSLVRTFEGIDVKDGKVTVAFSSAKSDGADPIAPPLLCGIEVTR